MRRGCYPNTFLKFWALLGAIMCVIFLSFGSKTAFAAGPLTIWQNMVSHDTARYYWYDSADTFLNLGYKLDLNNFAYWSVSTDTPFLGYVYLKQPTNPLNWDYSLTLPTDSEGYKFWIIQDGSSDYDRIFRYKSGGNWHYSECAVIKTITLADKTLQLSRCPGISENPITNVMVSMGTPTYAVVGIYLLVYTDENLDTLIYDETSMYNYLNNLANYNKTFGNWTSETGITLPAGTCDDLGTIAGALCRVITYLFVPTETSLNKFTQLKDIIANKPPFGYFTSVKNYLNNLNATSTPAFTFAEMGAINLSIFQPLKTGLTWILWIFFAFWVIKRIGVFIF